jgi:hypothetical protein
MAGASNGSEGCSESLIISGVDLCTSSEIAEMIWMEIQYIEYITVY